VVAARVRGTSGPVAVKMISSSGRVAPADPKGSAITVSVRGPYRRFPAVAGSA
jgi:hypothetical protein